MPKEIGNARFKITLWSLPYFFLKSRPRKGIFFLDLYLNRQPGVNSHSDWARCHVFNGTGIAQQLAMPTMRSVSTEDNFLIKIKSKGYFQSSN